MASTTGALALRDYQREAVAAVEAAWDRGVDRPAVVLPTGMGKTVIFAHLATDLVGRGLTPLILVHRDELVQQARAKIHSVAPDLRVGIVKAEQREYDADVIIASVQTLARVSRRMELERSAEIGAIIVDEAHHAAAQSYVDVLSYFGSFGYTGMSTPTVGFTATMTRADDKALGDVWQEVVYERTILDGIGGGHLTNVRGKRVVIEALDLGSVKKSGGDYQDASLGEAMEASGASHRVAEAYAEHAGDRQGVLFAPTVATAYSMADSLNLAGIVTETVEGNTPLPERHAIYERYRLGTTQVLSNCGVLTEGWDAPWASCAVIARPTTSQGLYVQMVGRVLRPWGPGGKVDALVLDVTGTSGMKLASLTDLAPKNVRVRDDESLVDAFNRSVSEQDLETIEAIDGVMRVTDVDLFARSSSAWLQTSKGVWFIPTQEDHYVLLPDQDGTWVLGTVPIRGKGGKLLKEGLTFEFAMAWAEQLATDADPMVSRRDASWRKRKQPPSTKQIGFAVTIGITVPEGCTKNQLSDLITLSIANRRLNPLVKETR